MKIKNWENFQHYKDRKPLWIKLYRELLDDLNWHNLSPLSAKTLVNLWLLASETNTGELPPPKELAFRLRISETELKQTLTKLNDWVVQDDSKLLAECYQDASLEKEKEKEKEKNIDFSFSVFWDKYPKKVGKQKAYSLWKKIKPPIGKVVDAIIWQEESEQWQKGYIPNPATYLNEGRWEDEPPEQSNVAKPVWHSTTEATYEKAKELNINLTNLTMKELREKIQETLGGTI